MALSYNPSWLDSKWTFSHDESNTLYSDTACINPVGFAVDIGPRSSMRVTLHFFWTKEVCLKQVL